MSLLDGLGKLPGMFNFRYERRDPERLRPWQVDPSGLILLREPGVKDFISWQDLAEVVTFKRDLGATDQICLGFRREGDDAYIVLEEENPSWSEVVAGLEARIPLPDGWFEEVMEPPFECNWTTLWGEPAARLKSG